MICPFCGTDRPIDLIALKFHLTHGNCEVWNQTDVMREIRAQHLKFCNMVKDALGTMKVKTNG